jgi:RNA polymerase sigma factor for flagellar operon FliA
MQVQKNKRIEIRKDMTENELTLSLLGLVKRMAAHMSHSLPANIRREELASAGMLGLVEAVRRFDPARCESFVGYAALRIRGAMLDELRRGDIMSQEARTQSRRLGKLAQSLEGTLGRAPGESDMAEALGLSDEQFRKDMGHFTRVQVLSFEAQDEVSPFSDSGAFDPHTAAEKTEERASLARAIAQIPERQQIILSLYYEQELTFQQIGDMLNITAARVCQLHGQSMGLLREVISRTTPLAA